MQLKEALSIARFLGLVTALLFAISVFSGLGMYLMIKFFETDHGKINSQIEILETEFQETVQFLVCEFHEDEIGKFVKVECPSYYSQR